MILTVKLFVVCTAILIWICWTCASHSSKASSSSSTSRMGSRLPINTLEIFSITEHSCDLGKWCWFAGIAAWHLSHNRWEFRSAAKFTSLEEFEAIGRDIEALREDFENFWAAFCYSPDCFPTAWTKLLVVYWLQKSLVRQCLLRVDRGIRCSPWPPKTWPVERTRREGISRYPVCLSTPSEGRDLAPTKKTKCVLQMSRLDGQNRTKLATAF